MTREHPPGLDDPARAAYAWKRYRRLLTWMTLAAIICGVGAAALLEQFYGPLTLIGDLAAIGGIGGSVLLAAALMGLVFLSSGTGHDERVDERD